MMTVTRLSCGLVAVVLQQVCIYSQLVSKIVTCAEPGLKMTVGSLLLIVTWKYSESSTRLSGLEMLMVMQFRVTPDPINSVSDTLSKSEESVSSIIQ